MTLPSFRTLGAHPKILNDVSGLPFHKFIFFLTLRLTTNSLLNVLSEEKVQVKLIPQTRKLDSGTQLPEFWLAVGKHVCREMLLRGL